MSISLEESWRFWLQIRPGVKEQTDDSLREAGGNFPDFVGLLYENSFYDTHRLDFISALGGIVAHSDAIQQAQICQFFFF